jgi:hypothetical protein
MRRSPSIASASPDDVDVYLVLDDFGECVGRAWREADEADTDKETVITDLLDGQYSDPIRIVAFNTAKGWSRDVSEEIADAIAQRCVVDGFDVPPFLERFVEWHRSGRPRQLPLPLRGAA